MPTPQRLPIDQGDDGTWGAILLQYLTKEHYDTGSDNAANGGHKTITIRAGTASANTAPLKFTSGTNLSSPETGAMEFSSNVLSFTPSSTRYTVLLSTLPDSQDISFGTSTGTKIGTSTSQKIGFFNATPITKPSGDIATALQDLGLVSSATVSPTGAVLTAPTSSTVNVIQPTGDYKPLIVRGNASQTTTLQEWQDSGNTVLASIASDGLASFNYGITAATHSAFGAATVDTAGSLINALNGTSLSAIINAQATLTDGTLTNNMGNVNGIIADATGNNSSNWAGMWGLTEVPTGNIRDYSGNIAGTMGSAYHYGTGTLAVLDGVIGLVDANSAGNITDAHAGRFISLHLGSGTVTNNYGLFTQQLLAGGSTVATNSYGLYVSPAAVLSGTGSFTNVWGARIGAQSAATTANYGLAMGLATTNTLWVNDTTDSTTEAGGAVFGLSKDTNLYRSAADTLKTDDSLTVGTNLTVTGTSALNDTVTIADGKNITLNTTTGTKIGTATTQKLGFYNATPVVQQTSDLGTALVAYGLLASASAVTFTKEVAATIKPADTVTAATAGAALSVVGGAGSPTTSGAGGAVSLVGGAGQAGNSGGGAANITGGLGVGLSIGGNVNIAGGAGLTGGTVIINAGSGVADGNVRLATTDGMVAVGHTSTPAAMLDVRGRLAATDALSVDNLAISGNIAIFKDNSTTVWTIADGGNLTAAEGINIVTGTTTGTKIGTATTQKLGFYNATPIVQPANTVAIDDVLVNLGLRATGLYSNFTTTIQPRAGTTAANTAPIKLTSGSLLTSAEAGAIEFLTDNLYFTQTTSTTRKKVATYDDSSGATGDIYYRDSSGYFVRLGIGSSNQVLGVSGGLPAWAQAIFATATKTATTYTISSSDTVIIADATSNNVTITLPVASGLTGYRFYVKRKDATANTVSIVRSGSDTIDGATSQTLDAQYTSATVVSDGSNWYII
jgi:hypothetical protein